MDDCAAVRCQRNVQVMQRVNPRKLAMHTSGVFCRTDVGLLGRWSALHFCWGAVAKGRYARGPVGHLGGWGLFFWGRGGGRRRYFRRRKRCGRTAQSLCGTRLAEVGIGDGCGSYELIV